MMAMPHQASSMYAEPHGGGAHGVSALHGLGHGHSGASAASFALNYQLMAPQVERTILTPGLGPIPPCTPNRTSWGESGLAPLPPCTRQGGALDGCKAAGRVLGGHARK